MSLEGEGRGGGNMQNTLIRVNFLEGVSYVERLIIIREALTKVSSDKLSDFFLHTGGPIHN